MSVALDLIHGFGGSTTTTTPPQNPYRSRHTHSDDDDGDDDSSEEGSSSSSGDKTVVVAAGGLLVETDISNPHGRYLMFAKATGAPCSRSGTNTFTCALGEDILQKDSVTFPLSDAFHHALINIEVLVRHESNSATKRIRIRISPWTSASEEESDDDGDDNVVLAYDAQHTHAPYRFAHVDTIATQSNLSEAQLILESTARAGEWTLFDPVRTRYLAVDRESGTLMRVRDITTIPDADGGQDAARFYFIAHKTISHNQRIQMIISQPTLAADACGAILPSSSSSTSSSTSCPSCITPQRLPTCCVSTNRACPIGHYPLSSSSSSQTKTCARIFPLNAFRGETMRDRQIACCTQKMSADDRAVYCPRELCPEGHVCQDIMRTFCQEGTNAKDYPECACFDADFMDITRLVGADARCVYKPCISPIAYKYTGPMPSCNIVNCIIDIGSVTAEEEADLRTNLSQDCSFASTSPVTTSSGTTKEETTTTTDSDTESSDDDDNKQRQRYLMVLGVSVGILLFGLVVFAVFRRRSSRSKKKK